MLRKLLRPVCFLLLTGAFVLPASDAVAEKKFRIKFGTLAPDNTPWSKLLQEFEDEIEKKSAGRVKVKVFLNGILGDERAMLQKMKFGQLSGGGFSTSGISTVVPELQIFEIPFLFRNNAEADHILDNVIRDDIATIMEKRGLYLLMWAENGWLDFGNQKRPIHTPADMRDIKWFTQESDVMIAFFDAMGVPAVPLAVPEVLNALQTGMVDGFHTTPIFATGTQWYSQTKYWTVSHHQYQPAAVVVDMKLWSRLPDDLKKITLDTAKDLQPRVRKEVRGLDEDLLAGFKKSGIEINHLSKAQVKEFEKISETVGEKLVQQGVFPQAMLDKVRKGLADYRAKNK